MSRDGFNDEFQIPQIRVPRPPSGLIRVIVFGVLGLVIVFSSFYTVSPEQVGVVLRFGEYVREAGPGLHFRIPFGIERVEKVPIQRQLKQEFGYRTAGVTRTGTQYTTVKDESLMLTGDLNAANVEWVVQYRIVDPYKYLFRVRDVSATFRAMSEAVMRRVIGDRTVNEVLTTGRQEVADLVEQQLQELCDQYETGIAVDQVVLQNVTPPAEVYDSFNEVNTAQQERARLINEAQSEYNRIIPRARGEAQQQIRQAEGYALDRVNRARGDSARFVAIYDEYQRAPDVTRTRIYLETMARVLPKVEQKIVVDDEVKSVLPLLNLNQMGGDK